MITTNLIPSKATSLRPFRSGRLREPCSVQVTRSELDTMKRSSITSTHILSIQRRTLILGGRLDSIQRRVSIITFIFVNPRAPVLLAELNLHPILLVVSLQLFTRLCSGIVRALLTNQPRHMRQAIRTKLPILPLLIILPLRTLRPLRIKRTQ